MPRRARIEVAGIPFHITHRGVNRCAVFVDDDDRRHYLNLLRRHATQQELRIHAYVLMSNHVHLLTSSDHVGATSAMMHRLGSNYVAAFNGRHRRTGTLWEGRFKSCPVACDRYLLAVHRYIELNPIRAALVDKPEDYVWSSARGNLGVRDDALVTTHPVFQSLASDPQGYRQWLDAGVDEAELAGIRLHIRQERALGDRRFQAMLEQTLGRPVAARPPGRPRKMA